MKKVKKTAKIEVKKDCFAYDEAKNNCKALKALYCEIERCNYYKKLIAKKSDNY